MTILIWTTTLNAQVTVDLYIYDTCGDSLLNIEDPFGYADLKLSGYKHEKNNNTFTLPWKGKHYIFITFQVGEYDTFYYDSLIYSQNGHYIDTIFLPKLCDCLKFWEFFGYTYCGEICNGHMIDYYKNGVMRIEGVFKDGYPIENLKLYNRKGKLIKEETYKGLRHVRTYYYNENENLEKVEIYKKKRKMKVKLFQNNN